MLLSFRPSDAQSNVTWLKGPERTGLFQNLTWFKNIERTFIAGNKKTLLGLRSF
jgi:hypothetical protein